jgi:hypothetical protein
MFPSVFQVFWFRIWFRTLRAAKLGTDGRDGKSFSIAERVEFFSQLLGRGINFNCLEQGGSLFFGLPARKNNEEVQFW